MIRWANRLVISFMDTIFPWKALFCRNPHLLMKTCGFGFLFLARSNIVVSYYSYCWSNCCVAEHISIGYIRPRSVIKVCMRVIWRAEAMRHKWKQKLQLPISHLQGVVRQSTAKPCFQHLRSQEYVIQLSHGNHPIRALSLLLGNTLMMGGKDIFGSGGRCFSEERITVISALCC